MTQTFESGYKTTLSTKLDAADTSMVVATAPTITSGRLYLTNGQQEEWISFTGVSGTTLTGLTRGLSQTADPATAGTGKTWIAGTTVKLVAMHDQLPDKQQGDAVLFSATEYATTAARDAALGGDGVATKNYIGIKCTDTGLHYNYNTSSGQWESIDTGTTTANASTTVAGKKEDATSAESKAGTDTGGTGATLCVLPSDIAANDQSGTFRYAGASAAGTDTYAVTMTPTLTAYTTGMAIIFKADVANTGACTINIDSLGAKSIKNRNGEDLADNDIIANQFVELIYDGTNMVLQNPAKYVVNELSGTSEYIFGDGSDGDVTISTNTTLTRDMYYNNLTIDSTKVLSPDGFKIYVKGTLTNNGTIRRNGNNGSNASGSTGGAGGAALTGNTLADTIAGGAGGNGGSSPGAGTAGAAANPSYTNTNGVAGGSGGGYGALINNGGAGGTSTRGNNYNTVFTLDKILACLSHFASSKVGHLTSLLSDTLYKGPAGSGGGGGGDEGVSSSGGGGGGAGSTGGCIWIAARTFDNTNGTIESIGGNGGNGANGVLGGGSFGAGGGGGGAGGNGGDVIVIYEILTSIGTTTLTGGTGGTGGTAENDASNFFDGTAGTNGAVGEVIQIQIA